MFKRDPVFWGACLTVAAIAVVIAVVSPTVANDCINRFAPMAEAFADGNWQEAFHPRFGVLFQTLTGLTVWMTGVRGDVACSVVGVVGWALCIVPLYLVIREVFDERTAKLAVVLYIVAPLPFAWALRGLRESYRLLGSLLMIFGILRGDGTSWRAFSAAAVGAAVLVCIRADTVIAAGVLAFAFAVRNRFRRQTWALFSVLAVAAQPCCLMVWQWTGWWVPSSQYISVLKHMTGG